MTTIVKRLLRMGLVLAIFPSILGVCATYAQPSSSGDMVEFVRGELGLSLSYPSSFTPLNAPSPQVILLLRPPEGRYPTFNILFQVGNPKVEEKSVALLKTDVVDSYRAVGLYDAEVVAGEKRQAAGRSVFYSEVRYKNRDEMVRAGVYVIPAQEEYYIMTYIDSEEHFAAGVPTLHQIVQSLKLTNPPPLPDQGRDYTQTFLWLGALLSILVFAKILMLVLGANKR